LPIKTSDSVPDHYLSPFRIKGVIAQATQSVGATLPQNIIFF